MKNIFIFIIALLFVNALFAEENKELSLMPEKEKKYAGIAENDWKYLESSLEKRDRSLVYPTIYTLATFGATIGGAFIFYTKEELHWTDVNHKNLTDNLTFKTYRWDNDRVFFNYVAHPYTGSESYLRMRMRGFDGFESWLFAFAASSFWEYFVEGWVEPVSFQDMVVTPCAGALFGELRFRAKLYLKKQNNIAADIGHFLIDPLQLIVEGVYSLFGGKKEDAPLTYFYFFYDDGKRRYYF